MNRPSHGALLLLLLAGCPSVPVPGQCRTSADCGFGATCIDSRCQGGLLDAGAGGGGAGDAGQAGGGVTVDIDAGAGGGTPTVPGETCATAIRLQASSQTVRGTTVGAANDVAVSCTGARNQGPDRVYVVLVPDGQRLTVTLTPDEAVDGGLQFDPALSLIAAPASNCLTSDAGDRNVCLAGSDVGQPPGATERLSWLNGTGATQEVFVLVDAFSVAPDPRNGTDAEGRFSLTLTLAEPLLGDRCDTAPRLDGGALTGQSLSGYSADYGEGPGCRRSDGPDRVYAVTVPAGQRLSATATPEPDAGFDLTLNFVAGPAARCEQRPLSCLSGVDAVGSGQAETLDFVNQSASAQEGFLVVGAYAATASATGFSLALSIVSPPTGDDCSTALPLVPGTPLTNQSLQGYGNEYATSVTCGAPAGGPDRVYALTVPPAKIATVTARAQPGLLFSLSLIDGLANCAPSSLRCVAIGTSPTATGTRVLAFPNRSAQPKTFFVLVDSAAPAVGTFELEAALSDPPSGDWCSNATPLASGAPQRGTVAGATNDYVGVGSQTCASFDTQGPDTVYGFQVPDGRRARVTVQPDAGFTPSLSLVVGGPAACETTPRVCAAFANSSSAGLARVVSFFNGTGQALEGFAIVDSTTGPGDFGVLLDLTTPPPDDVCTTAVTALGTTPLTNQVLRGGAAFERDYACVPSSRGPDRVYVVQAPANQRLAVTVTPTPQLDGGFDPVLSLIAGPASACDSINRRCVAGVDEGSRSAPETATFTNATSSPQTVFAVVGSYHEVDADTRFTLSASATPVPAGEVCDNALALSPGVRMGDSLQGYARDYALGPTCGRSSGADRVYSVQVGAAQTLTVRATPDALSDLVLNLVEGPASACSVGAVSCLATADRGSSGQEERLTWMNTGSGARQVFLVVSRFSVGAMTWSLETQLQ